MRAIHPLKGLIFLFIAACLMTACSTPRGSDTAVTNLSPFAPENRRVIAVMPFEFKGEQEKYGSLSGKILDITVVELFRTERFRIVERNRIDALLEEVKLGLIGLTDEATAARIGQQVGAEVVMLGTLSSVKPVHQRDSLGFMWREFRGFEVTMQGRLIDISSGEVMAVGEATASEIQQEKMAVGARTGIIDPEETLINRALEKAVKGIVNQLAKSVTQKSL